MKHVPFTNEQEIPDILTKWKAPIRDGPLENLLGGEGSEVQKNIRAREN